MRGRIIRGIAGFYYVQTGHQIYECKAKGIFRKDKKKPLPGDYVEIDILDEAALTANISVILPRTNELIRPGQYNADIGGKRRLIQNIDFHIISGKRLFLILPENPLRLAFIYLMSGLYVIKTGDSSDYSSPHALKILS